MVLKCCGNQFWNTAHLEKTIAISVVDSTFDASDIMWYQHHIDTSWHCEWSHHLVIHPPLIQHPDKVTFYAQQAWWHHQHISRTSASADQPLGSTLLSCLQLELISWWHRAPQGALSMFSCCSFSSCFNGCNDKLKRFKCNKFLHGFCEIDTATCGKNFEAATAANHWGSMAQTKHPCQLWVSIAHT